MASMHHKRRLSVEEGELCVFFVFLFILAECLSFNFTAQSFILELWNRGDWITHIAKNATCKVVHGDLRPTPLECSFKRRKFLPVQADIDVVKNSCRVSKTPFEQGLEQEAAVIHPSMGRVDQR